MCSFVQNFLNGFSVFCLEALCSVPKAVEFGCPPEVDKRKKKGNVDTCLEVEFYDVASLGSFKPGPDQVGEESEGVDEEGCEHPGEGQECPEHMLPVPDEVQEGLQVCCNVHPVEEDIEDDKHENLHLGV